MNRISRYSSRRLRGLAVAVAMTVAMTGLVLVAGSAIGGSPAVPAAAPLKGPEAFASIRNTTKRSKAIFAEAGKVLTHSRCVNCHPSGAHPLQGETGVQAIHEPPVSRGSDGRGMVGMRCQTCHRDENFDPAGLPGSKGWHLAPESMAWQGMTASQICQQIKDPQRNGGRSVAEIVSHIQNDHFVHWAWAPGGDRTPAPGNHATFAQLIAEWASTGAACP